jgi:hypothetical protein
MKIKMVVAALGLAMAVSAPAQAQPGSTGPLMDRDNDVSCVANLSGFNSSLLVRCGGSFRGNPVQNAPGDIDILNWLAETPTVADPGPSDGGGMTDPYFLEARNSNGLGAYLNLSNDIGQKSGRIAFTNDVSGSFALVLKGGNYFSIFVFEGADELDGVDFVMNGVGDNIPALSNISLYGGGGDVDPFCFGDDCQPTSVPEPSSFAMMFAGLLGLGVAARRRRNA